MSSPTIDQVLRQVDFELAQGLVARTDLRRALRELRAFHEKTRAGIFDDDVPERFELREALSRQFQMNDMLLGLLGEAVEAAEQARGESRRAHEYLRQAFDADLGSEPSATVSPMQAEAPRTPLDDPSPWEPLLDPIASLEDPESDPEEEVSWAMRPERLWLLMDQRPPRIPLIGGILRRFRTALHTRVLIYAGQLGDKQSAVNRILGDHLLRVIEVVRAQSRTLDALRLRLHRLETRAREKSRPSDHEL